MIDSTIGKESKMINNVSGRNNSIAKLPQATSPLTEDKTGRRDQSAKTTVNIVIEPAVKVEISNEARLAALQIKDFDTATSFLKLNEDVFSQEARERRMAATEENLANLPIDPFDNEFQILHVHSTFMEGTLEHFITDALDGKARNASLIAGELGQMIRSAAYSNGTTIEERATLREIGMQHAEYIAKNYFDNPDEAKAFLDVVRGFYENDILRDKGYTVIEGTNIAPFKSYTMPGAPSDYKSITAIARQFGASEEILSDPLRTFDFFVSVFKNQIAESPETNVEWQDDIVKNFNDNEQRVADIIDHIKANLNAIDVESSLLRLLKAF
jgi:hypothetical protein